MTLLEAAKKALPGLVWRDNRGVLSAQVLHGKWLKAQHYDGNVKVVTWVISGGVRDEQRRKHESADVAAAFMREQVRAMRGALDVALGEAPWEKVYYDTDPEPNDDWMDCPVHGSQEDEDA